MAGTVATGVHWAHAVGPAAPRPVYELLFTATLPHILNCYCLNL